jgi:hypothetical protein
MPTSLARIATTISACILDAACSTPAAFALAIEHEGTATTSATILAIAPDGTVLYTTTIVEP